MLMCDGVEMVPGRFSIVADFIIATTGKARKITLAEFWNYTSGCTVVTEILRTVKYIEGSLDRIRSNLERKDRKQ